MVVPYVMWLILFSIVFKAACIIRRHKRHCHVMISPPIRTVLPIDVAFSEIYLSIIWWIGLLWRLCRRFAVCSFRTNQTFGCWIQRSNNFFSIWVKSILLNWNKNNSSRNEHDKYERKILFLGLPSGYQNHVKPSASLGFYVILIHLGWNGRIFNGSLWKSLIVCRIYSHKRKSWTYSEKKKCDVGLHINSFAVKFLTQLFSQCQIYFDHKGHTAICSQKYPYNLFFYFYF